MKIEATLKSRFFGKCSSLFALAIIFSTAFSQAPQKFNYQGIARGQAGNILTNKSLSFKISILQGSPTGTSVYSESHNVVSDNSGVFSLEVGAGAILSGTFSAIGWGSNSHYLKTEMDTAGGANYLFIGTTQLLSVPYALNAGNSSNGGFSNFQVFDTSGVFTIPNGVIIIMVEVWGGGGGGTGSGSLGGCAGGFGRQIFSVTPGTNFTVTVGGGGTGALSGNGQSGGTSSFGTLIRAW